jgi:ATP-binding cassette, subfamily C, bacterial LapB
MGLPAASVSHASVETGPAVRPAPAPRGIPAVADLGSNSLRQLLKEALRLPAPIIVASFTINVLGLALPLAVVQVFDRVLRNHALSTLILLMAGLFGLIIAETVLRFARNELIGRLALRESFELHMRGVLQVMKAPRAAIAQLSADRISDALTAMDEMSQFLAGHGRLALLDFPFVFLFLGVIWAIGGLIAVIPAMLIAAFFLWTVWSSANFKRALKDQVHLDQERFDFYAECLRGIATVKSLAVEPQMQRRIERHLQLAAPISYELTLRANRMIASGQFFANLTMISVVTVGGILAIHGHLSIGAVAACSLIANRVTQPVLRIIGVWGQMEAAKLARERFLPLLALPSTVRQPKEHEAVSVALDGMVMLDAPERARRQPNDFTFEAGEVVGILGRDFAQRAQLLGHLRGLIPPPAGAVRIDGGDLAGPDGETLLQGVIYVGSEPTIFRGTILDNISMFRRTSHVFAIAIARRLGVEDIIKLLPEGYDTMLGDVGTAALPLDILQAICIVRAVAMRPCLLLLDVRRVPPDDVSIRACARAVKELRGRATIIILGERMSEIDDADRVLILDNWRLHEITSRRSGATRHALNEDLCEDERD